MKPPAYDIYLSPPHLSDGYEQEFVQEAIASNWIAPVGPHVDAFEQEFSELLGIPSATAVASGTAALHLALRLLGVRSGDEVFCSTLTFIASAAPIVYQQANPVFIDSDADSWNMSPELLSEALADSARRRKLPKVVIVVDLYGQSADYEPILATCQRYDVPVIEDAAESLGATYKGRPVGGFGRMGVFSFNGNKIITTSGGGMLVGEEALTSRARFLATHARDPAPYYQHTTVGYNYRLSNLLAAVGRGQLKVLEERVEARRANFEHYCRELSMLPGLDFMPEASYGCHSRWLTCLTVDPGKFGATREDIRLALAEAKIEARPVWKPLHLQPAFADCEAYVKGVSRRLFETGLCLPSGSSLTSSDRSRVIEIVKDVGGSNAVDASSVKVAE